MVSSWISYKKLERIFAMVSSWISKKLWRVFLQGFHGGFQKRFREYFGDGFILDFKKGLESPDSAELWRPPPNSWSCNIPPPPRQLWMMVMMRMRMMMVMIIIIIIMVIVILLLLGRCWHHLSIFWVAHHSLVTWWEHVDFDFFVAVARTDFENQDSCDWLTENGWETGPSTLFNRTYHSSHILGENQVHSFQQALFQRAVQETIDLFWWAAGLALIPQRFCR